MQIQNLKIHSIKVVEQIKEIVKDFFVRGGQEGAALLTITTLLAFVPLLTIIYAVASAFPILGDSNRQLQEFILSNLLHESGVVAMDYLTSFSVQAKSLTGIGIGFLVVTSILMLKTIDTQFNKLWMVSPRKLKLNTIVLYWAILTLGPVLLGGVLMVDAAIRNMALFSHNVIENGFYLFWIKFFSVTLSILVLSLCYTLIPNTRVPFKSGVAGALFAVLSIFLLKQGFAMYLQYFPTYQLIYGAFVAIPLFIIWIYVTWCLVIAGAIITKNLTYYKVHASEQVQHDGVITLLLLDALLCAQSKGKGVDIIQFHHHKPIVSRAALHTVLEKWVSAGLITYSHDDKVILLKPLHLICWGDILSSHFNVNTIQVHLDQLHYLSKDKVLTFLMRTQEETDVRMRQTLDAMCESVKPC